MFFNHGITRHEPDVVGAITTHLSLKAVLNRWGKKGRDLIHSDMNQLHIRDTFLLIHWKNMSYDQRKQTLESHMFLEENRDRTIKGIALAGGNKHRYFIF